MSRRALRLALVAHAACLRQPISHLLAPTWCLWGRAPPLAHHRPSPPPPPLARSYLVSADDFSTVRLFNYPVVWDDAPFKAFRGHASHVMCVRFSSDDRRVLSTGGNDRCVFQWRTMGVCEVGDKVACFFSSSAF